MQKKEFCVGYSLYEHAAIYANVCVEGDAKELKFQTNLAPWYT